jgi:hypothetical protein
MNDQKYKSGYIHLTAEEKEFLFQTTTGIVNRSKPDDVPDGFTITDPIVIRTDRNGWQCLNQIILKIISSNV